MGARVCRRNIYKLPRISKGRRKKTRKDGLSESAMVGLAAGVKRLLGGAA